NTAFSRFPLHFPQSADFSQTADSYRFKFLIASICLPLISGLTTTVSDIATQQSSSPTEQISIP
ncbi:MAG: hypothetical protein IJV20_08440, partial [Prevotella sp.]|nr:hypothetical protein [Prevotella sp.]